jgi:hypothetical protein
MGGTTNIVPFNVGATTWALEFCVKLVFAIRIVEMLLQSFFFGAFLCEFNKFDACSTDRMGPVDRAFRMCNTTRNFVKEIRRRDRANKRSDKVSWEGIQSLVGAT